MSHSIFGFDEQEFVRRAARKRYLSKEDAELYLLRGHEYFRARGLEAYPGMGEINEPLSMSAEEQMCFTAQTTDLTARKVSELSRLDMRMQYECGMIDFYEGIDEICTFQEEDRIAGERWFDFSEIFRKLGYMYENGIGFDKDLKIAEEWYERGRSAGWDDSKPFAFRTYTPEPVRAG